MVRVLLWNPHGSGKSAVRTEAHTGGNMQHLIPNSKEWLAALAKSNPQEAAHAKQIIKSAGTTEVCSDCGGTPASDYEIADKLFVPGVAATIRLCEDCLSTRATTEGERLVPLPAGAR
jgi:hypothetical protein